VTVRDATTTSDNALVPETDEHNVIHLSRAYYWMQLRLCVLEGVPVDYIVIAKSIPGSVAERHAEPQITLSIDLPAT
jgi:hypothetical protein